MDLALLATLKDKLAGAKKFSEVLDFFLTNFGEKQEFMALGGPARESPAVTLMDFAAGLKAGPNVRGAIIGRNLLFPGQADPLPMCRALTALVHGDAGLDGALQVLDQEAQAEATTPRRTGKRGHDRK